MIVLVLVVLIILPLLLYARICLREGRSWEQRQRWYEEERFIRQSPAFDRRMRLIGVFLFCVGVAALYFSLVGDFTDNKRVDVEDAVVFGVLLLGLGVYYAIRGAKAESLRPPPRRAILPPDPAYRADIARQFVAAVEARDDAASNRLFIELLKAEGRSPKEIEAFLAEGRRRAEVSLTPMLEAFAKFEQKNDAATVDDIDALREGISEVRKNLGISSQER